MSRGRRETDGREQRDGAGAAGKKAYLHDANPPVLGTRTGRPSDAPIPLCLCKTPASTIPRSGSIAGGMAPAYLSLWRWIGSNANGRIGRTQINQMVMVSSEVPVHCHHPFTVRLQA